MTLAARQKLTQQLAAEVRAYMLQQARLDISRGRPPLEYAQPARQETSYRFAAIYQDAGLDNERLLKRLTPSILHQLVPPDWELPAGLGPSADLAGRWVRTEVPYPDALQEKQIRLTGLGQRPDARLGLKIGPNVQGRVIFLPLNDITHILVAGNTGSGKSTSIRALAYQLALARVPTIYIDGKEKDGLGILRGSPGLQGPIATNAADVLAALGWAITEMDRRYAQKQAHGGRAIGSWDEPPPHLVILIDEVQTYRHEAAIGRALFELAGKGRAVRMHLIIGTQRPTVAMFGAQEGGYVREQIMGLYLAHAVSTSPASIAATGGSRVRADYLLGQGDAHLGGLLGATRIQWRVQVAYVTEEELLQVAGGEPVLATWPEFDLGRLGADLPAPPGRPTMEFSATQQAAAVFAAQQHPRYGRGKLQRLLRCIEESVAGAETADRLLAWGREQHAALSACACLP